jgi:hypothetical protein
VAHDLRSGQDLSLRRRLSTQSRHPSPESQRQQSHGKQTLLSPSRVHPHPHRGAKRSTPDLSLPRVACVGNARPNGRARPDPSRTGVRARPECKLVSESSSNPRPKQPSVRTPLAPVAAQTARSALLASASPSSKGLADKAPPRFEPMSPFAGVGRSRLSSPYVQNMR